MTVLNVVLTVALSVIILWSTRKMSESLNRLTSEVAENTTVVQSAITLLNNLSQIIRDSVNDPAALNALADQLDTQSNSLAAAITANTPAEPPGEDTTSG